MNYYDETKDLLKKSKLLREQDESKYTVGNGSIIIYPEEGFDVTLTNIEKTNFQQTLTEFTQQVTNMANFNPMEIRKGSLKWSGQLPKFNATFYYFIGDKNVCAIGGDMIKIDDELIKVVQALNDYYKMFTARWSKLLTDRTNG